MARSRGPSLSEEDSERRKVEMKSLYDSGLTLQDVGDTYGMSRERVRQIIGNVGHREYPSSKKEFLKTHIKQITEMWEQGSKFSEIAAWFHVDSQWIRSLKLPPNYIHQTHGTLQSYRHGCKCDECRAANADCTRNFNHELRRKGLCIKCHAKSPDHWRCDKCAGRVNKSAIRRKMVAA